MKKLFLAVAGAVALAMAPFATAAPAQALEKTALTMKSADTGTPPDKNVTGFRDSRERLAIADFNIAKADARALNYMLTKVDKPDMLEAKDEPGAGAKTTARPMKTMLAYDRGRTTGSGIALAGLSAEKKFYIKMTASTISTLGAPRMIGGGTQTIGVG